MNEITVGITALIILLLFFLTGIELAFVMAIIGFAGFSYLVSFEAASNLLAKDLYDTFTSYGLTVIPIFVFMGQILFYSGIAKKIYDAAYKFVGHVPGGLAMTTVVGATAFKAMCGSTLATCATFCSVAIPEMNRYGYSKKLSNGLVAAVGSLGIILPPSITLIIFAIITEQSIGRIFLAGVFPSLIISFFFILIIYYWAKSNPAIAPRGEKSTWGERTRALPDLLYAIIIFVFIIGGIMKGLFSPTEAGTIGTAAALILALTRGKLTFKGVINSFDESLRVACMVLLLIAGSNVLGHFLAVTEIPLIAADWIYNLPLNRHIVMVLVVLIYLIGGSFVSAQ